MRLPWTYTSSPRNLIKTGMPFHCGGELVAEEILRQDILCAQLFGGKAVVFTAQ